MRLLGLGDNTVDTYVDHGEQYPGGNALNVAVLARRLGAEAAYLGCFGSDEGGDILRVALAAEQVDISRCRHRSGENARAFIGHKKGDRKFLTARAGVRADYRFDSADFDYIALFDHVHTSIFSEIDLLLPQLRQKASQVSYDFSEHWSRDLLKSVLPHIDIPCLSAPRLTEHELDELIDFCRKQGASRGLVTQGVRGATAWYCGRVLRQPSIPVEVVDTLGAGDGFIAAFLMASIAGKGLDEALTSGARFAALVCGWKGAFGRGAEWRGERPVLS